MSSLKAMDRFNGERSVLLFEFVSFKYQVGSDHARREKRVRSEVLGVEPMMHW